MVNHIVGNIVLPSTETLDYNQDSVIDILDVTLIIDNIVSGS